MKEAVDSGSGPVDQINVGKKQWLGFGFAFFLTWGVALFLWYQGDIDKDILFFLNNSNFNHGMTVLFQVVSSYGMASIAFVFLCCLILSFRLESLKGGKQIFLFIIMSFALAGITGDILKEIFMRTRPIVQYADEIRFLTGSDSPSFPSGHATKSVALVLPFLFYANYTGRFNLFVKCLLALIASMVCFSRIFLGAHFLSDVMAGMGIAALCLPISVALCNRVFIRRMTFEKLETAAKKWIFVYAGLIILLILI